jgi:hypothetical protein
MDSGWATSRFPLLVEVEHRCRLFARESRTDPSRNLVGGSERRPVGDMAYLAVIPGTE